MSLAAALSIVIGLPGVVCACLNLRDRLRHGAPGPSVDPPKTHAGP